MAPSCLSVIVLAAMLAICMGAGVKPQFDNVQFIRCYDGDTCYVNLNDQGPPDNWKNLFGVDIPIRVLGIDTPEMKSDSDVEHCLAVYAQNYLEKRLRPFADKPGTIKLVEASRGKYFRIVARIHAPPIASPEREQLQAYLSKFIKDTALVTKLLDIEDMSEGLIAMGLAVSYQGDTKLANWKEKAKLPAPAKPWANFCSPSPEAINNKEGDAAHAQFEAWQGEEDDVSMCEKIREAGKEAVEKLTVADLKKLCKAMEIKGYSKLKKAQLVQQVWDHAMAAAPNEKPKKSSKGFSLSGALDSLRNLIGGSSKKK